jgi:hypothetical protein
LAAVGLAGVPQDPILELHDSDGLVLAFNNDWRDSQENEIMLARATNANQPLKPT